MHICHSDFLALINIRGSLHGQKHSVQHFLALFAVLPVISPAGHGSWLVMVGPVQTVPCLILENRLPFAEACL